MASTWKRDFASGLVVVVPLLVTLFTVNWFYQRVAGIPIPVEFPPLRVALTLLVFILLVFAVGYLMRTALGSVVESTLDDLMNRLPGLRVVYNASKMAVDTALSGTDDLQAPVKLETWEGMRMTAFKTGKTTADGREVLFLPTAPNITTGYVIEVPPDRYDDVDETVEDALTRILSAGFGDSEEMGPVPLSDLGEDESPEPGEEVPVPSTDSAAESATEATPNGGTETGQPDTGQPDTGQPDTGQPDTGPPEPEDGSAEPLEE